jgi:hypothetical protein
MIITLLIAAQAATMTPLPRDGGYILRSDDPRQPEYIIRPLPRGQGYTVEQWQPAPPPMPRHPQAGCYNERTFRWEWPCGGGGR